MIFNPAAGKGNRALLDEVINQLKLRNWRAVVRLTNGTGDAERIVSSGVLERAGSEILVIAGGDGTTNEVVNGLYRVGRLDIPICVVPTGTVNLLAGELGFGKSAKVIVDSVVDGKLKSVVLSKITGSGRARIFLVTAGIGFDANAVSRASKTLKKVHSRGAYVIAGILQYLLGRFPKYRANIGEKEYIAGSILVANGKFYAARMIWAPNANISKGYLEVGVFRILNRIHLPIYIFAMAFGFLSKIKNFDLVRCKEINLCSPVGQPVQADGDIVAWLPVRISIMKERVKFFSAEESDKV